MLARLHTASRLFRPCLVRTAAIHTTFPQAAIPKVEQHNANQSPNSPSFDPKDSAELAARAASLQLFMSRWASELFHKQQIEKNERYEQNEQLVNASEAITSTAIVTDIVDFMTEEERSLIMNKFGTWDEDTLMKHMWGWEAMGTLLWKLGVIPEIPSYCETFDRKELLISTQIQSKQPETLAMFIDRVTSNDVQAPEDNAVVCARAVAEIWYWRSTAHSLLQLQQASASNKAHASGLSLNRLPPKFREMIRGLPQEITSMTARELSAPMPYRSINEHQHQKLHGIAKTRRQAFAWLSGRIPEWNDTVPGKLMHINQNDGVWATLKE
ncbi:hypothetical protein BDF19DRAFT_421109 [Syncephalis fuscata]|nr:hypothetical protein BDF19DRAFT_421109 [Syncephalis fuscata]